MVEVGTGEEGWGTVAGEERTAGSGTGRWRLISRVLEWNRSGGSVNLSRLFLDPVISLHYDRVID